MADRGRPLPFAMKQQIKARTATEPVKRVARDLDIDPKTARKYQSPGVRQPGRPTT